MEYHISIKAAPLEMKDLLTNTKVANIVFHKNMNQSNLLADPVEPVLYAVVLQADPSVGFVEGKEYTSSEYRELING